MAYDPIIIVRNESTDPLIIVRNNSSIIVVSEGIMGPPGGNLVAPSETIDNSVPRFDGTDGETLQDSGVTIDDDDNMDVPGTLTAGNFTGFVKIHVGIDAPDDPQDGDLWIDIN